jgi:hypothetical protein
MSSNLKRLAAVAAVGAVAALAPVASASAATPTGLPAFTLPAYHHPSFAWYTPPALPGFMPAGLGFVPAAGSIVGPTVITNGDGNVFTGTTITTTGGGAVVAAGPSVP